MAVFIGICFNFAILFNANLALFALLLSIVAEALREPAASILNLRYVNCSHFLVDLSQMQINHLCFSCFLKKMSYISFLICLLSFSICCNSVVK